MFLLILKSETTTQGSKQKREQGSSSTSARVCFSESRSPSCAFVVSTRSAMAEAADLPAANPPTPNSSYTTTPVPLYRDSPHRQPLFLCFSKDECLHDNATNILSAKPGAGLSLKDQELHGAMAWPPKFPSEFMQEPPPTQLLFRFPSEATMIAAVKEGKPIIYTWKTSKGKEAKTTYMQPPNPKIHTFDCWELPSKTPLTDFRVVFDNDPSGHWTLQPTTAESTHEALVLRKAELNSGLINYEQSRICFGYTKIVSSFGSVPMPHIRNKKMDVIQSVSQWHKRCLNLPKSMMMNTSIFF